jgi:hypothetical protein
MRRTFPFIIVIVSLFSAALASNATTDTRDAGILGNYLEVRTADVWTGPCFANGEVNLVGKEAFMAWEVQSGSWDGVSLDGLKVVAVLRSNRTLGDPFARNTKTRSLLLVDERASREQRDALVRFAKTMGGELLDEVVEVESMPINMEIVADTGMASLKAGGILELKTRALNHHDIHCGNEAVYYPPLAATTSAKPAFALANRFSGVGLDATWSCPSKRSAFIGTFAR